MREIPKQAAKAADNLDNDAVHDLRVALRRCRSMAAGFRAIDPDKNWKKMRRQATDLFDSLGDLRDSHVMTEWLEQLAPAGDPTSHAVVAYLREQESGLETQARTAIKSFDVPQWHGWVRILPERASHLPVGSEAFQALALEQLNTARRMQSPALRKRGGAEFHRLRIEVKKFRYIVENFLPEQHEQWKDGLKLVQDLLGEIHDLDVLRETILRVTGDSGSTTSSGSPAPSPGPLLEIIARERDARIERYRQLMSGEKSLWRQWRSGLPRGLAARHASMHRLQAWSSYLDSDLRHSRRVARFSVQIYDGLARHKILQGNSGGDRELLRAASIVHEVGRAEGSKNHHKTTEKMVSGLNRLAGWKRQEVNLMARIARYHRGALPRPGRLSDLPPAEWQRIRLLAGILRLANALDGDHSGSIRSISVRNQQAFVTISASGLDTDSDNAERIAAARYLLETACGVPVMVQPGVRARMKARSRTAAKRVS